MSLIEDRYVVDLLRQLISIPTVFPPENKQAMLQMRDFVSSEMSRHGLSVRVEGDEGEDWVRPNVIGTITGDGSGPTLMLDAHTDVVPVYDRKRWTVDPFSGEILDGCMYGRGAADTKGSLAAMLAGTFAVARSGVRLTGTAHMVAWAGDEWHPSDSEYFNGMTYLAENGLIRADMGIFGEPYDLRITYLARGRVWYRITIGGEATHSATGKGINAIVKALQLIEQIYGIEVGQHPVLGRDSINVGTIEGGNQPNMVPDWCTFVFDIRFASPLTVARVRAMVEEKIADCQARDRDFIVKSAEVIAEREPLEFPRDSVLNAAIRKAGGRIGLDLGFGGGLSFGDVAEWKDKIGMGEGCLFGPGETKQAHAVDEHVRVEDVVNAAKIYALTILYACGYKE
ncbi:MAG: M20 family metallopeptidase [bacterium]|nr:M20 family metallopeptidase [bacterium]